MERKRASRPERRPIQLELPAPKTHGGKRKGAGRPKTDHAGALHFARPPLASRFPVHVTLKAREDAPRFRRKRSCDVLRTVMAAGCDKETFRLCHFSIQPGHVHLICEARDTVSLSRGVQGLAIRMARALNREWDRRGPVWADRYHARHLKTPTQTRSAIVYVLGNFRHHGGEKTSPMCIDEASSAYWFTGYREEDDLPQPPDIPRPVADARTWLLSAGWIRAGGLISMAERPRS
ncbi:MAG: transposase [Deltaproteobacteria bacterium]|nr:transposase [Deltaproteobacteria bacterium]